MGSSWHPVRLGDYELLRRLAVGGMAELFLARRLDGLRKHVALKKILPHRAANERFVRMFLNEARLAASLDHPNIASVYDVGCEQQEYFFTMEYVHGQDLRRVLARSVPDGLPLEHAITIALGVCAGLHYAHERKDPDGLRLSIVHRDVSPSNVIISYAGAVKVVDFGVAKAASIASETRAGGRKGKIEYMSPEQVLGETLDRRSDVFAIGILLWEMTTGQPLYRGGDVEVLDRIAFQDIPPPSTARPGYPSGLERIVMRALARDRNRRHPTAEALQLELEAFATEQRLLVAPAALGRFMEARFAEPVRAWREAEQSGVSLVDHIATTTSGGSSDAGSDPALEADTWEPQEIAGDTQAGTPPAVVLAAAAPTPRPPLATARLSVRLGRAAAAAATLLAIGVGLWIAFGGDPPSPGPPPVKPAPRPAAAPSPSVEPAAAPPPLPAPAPEEPEAPSARPARQRESETTARRRARRAEVGGKRAQAADDDKHLPADFDLDGPLPP